MSAYTYDMILNIPLLTQSLMPVTSWWRYNCPREKTSIWFGVRLGWPRLSYVSSMRHCHATLLGLVTKGGTQKVKDSTFSSKLSNPQFDNFELRLDGVSVRNCRSLSQVTTRLCSSPWICKLINRLAFVILSLAPQPSRIECRQP